MRRHRYTLATAQKRSGLSAAQVSVLLENGLIRGRWDDCGWSTTPAELLMAWKNSVFSKPTRKGRKSKGEPQAKIARKGVSMESTPSALTLSAEHEAKAAQIQAELGIDIRPTLLAAKAAGRLEPYSPTPPTPRQIFRQALGLKKTADELRETHPELARQVMALARERLTAASQAAQA